LLSTGRLVWKKGFDYLLTALSTLARRGVEFEARIVGEGELFNVLRFSIEDLGLRDRVRLEGAMTSQQVLEQLQRTDVFVLPSVEEGISNAVLEAMATGVPIVTTNAGGMAEAITDGNEGFVVPVRDVEMLADRIEKLVRDPHLRASMGAIARQRAEREFSIARQVKGFEDIYEAVLGEWNKQAC
jgi:colanic acid/amylovoran biosynthesis glycosyltransferase